MPSFGTIGGFIAGIVLFTTAVSQATDDYIIFLSVPSVLLVVGGTISATFLSFEVRDIFSAFFGMFFLFFKKNNEKGFRKDIKMLLDFAKIQRTEGMLQIEMQLTRTQRKDVFISFAVDLLLSNYRPAEIRSMLTDMVLANFDKGNLKASVMRTMGAYSPAFGMIGTLIGLIIILSGFGGDISQLGAGLSLALISTLYGVLLANFTYYPAAEKFARNTDLQHFREKILLEGFVLIAARKGALAIQDKLNSLLTPELRYKINSSQ